MILNKEFLSNLVLILFAIGIARVSGFGVNFGRPQGEEFINYLKGNEGPLNIDTQYVKCLECGKGPLVISKNLKQPRYLCNNGTTIKITGDPGTQAYLSGGFLKGRYTIHETRFFWANSKESSCVDRIDGRGFSVAAMSIFTNDKYKGSYDEAIKYKDGVVFLVVQILVTGHMKNAKFQPFRDAMQKILQPNTCVRVGSLLEVASWWFVNAGDYPSYYVYPSQVYNGNQCYAAGSNALKFPSATEITFPLTNNLYISIEEFEETFGRLGFTNAATPFDSPKTTVFECNHGVRVVNLS